MLILTNFNRFEVILHSLKTKKGLELGPSFQAAVFVKFCEIFSFVI